MPYVPTTVIRGPAPTMGFVPTPPDYRTMPATSDNKKGHRESEALGHQWNVSAPFAHMSLW
jgi:hypothetical protein